MCTGLRPTEQEGWRNNTEDVLGSNDGAMREAKGSGKDRLRRQLSGSTTNAKLSIAAHIEGGTDLGRDSPQQISSRDEAKTNSRNTCRRRFLIQTYSDEENK